MVTIPQMLFPKKLRSYSYEIKKGIIKLNKKIKTNMITKTCVLTGGAPSCILLEFDTCDIIDIKC